MAKTKPTSAEIEEMRAAVAAADAEVAAQRAADRAAYIQPLADLVASPAWAEVRDRARAMRPDYADDSAIAVHLNPLADFMTRLTGLLPVSAAVE